MNVLVALEQRYLRTPSGVWSPGGAAYEFWARYLNAFDSVRVLARVQPASQVPPSYKRVDGERVSVADVPYYRGPAGYVRRWFQIQAAVRRAYRPYEAVILRVGSQVAACLEPVLRTASHPYALEVVGDPCDVFAPDSVHHPLRPFLRRHFTRQLKRMCENAAAAAYVTQHTLQRRYPCSGLSVGVSDVALSGVFTTSFSSVALSRSDFAAAPRWRQLNGHPMRIATVGSLEQPYKGVDVLLKAVAKCHRDGTRVECVVIGDGRYRLELERLAIRLRLGAAVTFLGHLPGPGAVSSEVAKADAFVLASRTEGLPRALIEAMALGLPCIATAVGGIPELLDRSALVERGSPQALAVALRRCAADDRWRLEQAGRNLEQAAAYCEERLETRRTEFYRHVRAVTERWLSEGSGAAPASAGRLSDRCGRAQ